MRLFVAVELSDEARRAIAAEQRRIAAALANSSNSLKLVAPERMHLTLLFLGEVQEAGVPGVIETVGTAVDLTAFDIGFGGAGVFPTRGAPRVLWMGVSGDSAPLTRLQSEIVKRIRGLGIAFDDRPFHPHLTLGRWRESRSSDRAKVQAAAGRTAIARVHVDRATLYRSDLSPAGASHIPLAHARLTQVGVRV